jgi:hypothetical protein
MKKVALSPAAAFASGTIPIEPMATAKARLAESKILFIALTPQLVILETVLWIIL